MLNANSSCEVNRFVVLLFTVYFVEWSLPAHRSPGSERGPDKYCFTRVRYPLKLRPQGTDMEQMLEGNHSWWRKSCFFVFFFFNVGRSSSCAETLHGGEKWSNMREKRRRENDGQRGPEGKTAGNPSTGLSSCKLGGKFGLKRLFLKKAISSTDTKEMRRNSLSNAARNSSNSSGAEDKQRFPDGRKAALGAGEPVLGRTPHWRTQEARAYFLPPGIWNNGI